MPIQRRLLATATLAAVTAVSSAARWPRGQRFIRTSKEGVT
jgi:hypothetical protein